MISILLNDFSIGIDIEEISKFQKMKYENKKNFYNKIFTENEIKYCLSKKNPYPHFTVRFCAKEAAIKATGNLKLKLTEIEIIIINKKPILKIPTMHNTKISLSHSSKYAIAIVMISGEDK